MVVGPGTTRSIYQLACSKADVVGNAKAKIVAMSLGKCDAVSYLAVHRTFMNDGQGVDG